MRSFQKVAGILVMLVLSPLGLTDPTVAMTTSETECFAVPNFWANLHSTETYEFTLGSFAKEYKVRSVEASRTFSENNGNVVKSAADLGLEHFVGTPAPAGVWPINELHKQERVVLAGNQDHVYVYVIDGMDAYEMVAVKPDLFDGGNRCHVRQLVNDGENLTMDFDNDMVAHDPDEECFGWDTLECFNGGTEADTSEGHYDFEFIMHGDTDYCEAKGSMGGSFPWTTQNQSWATDFHEVLAVAKDIFHAGTIVNLGGSGTSGHCYFGTASPFNETRSDGDGILKDYKEVAPGSGSGPYPLQVYHLFTGRMDDGTLIGLASCGKGFGMSNQTFSDNVAYRGYLLSHEIGHNFWAGHQDQICGNGTAAKHPGAYADTVSSETAANGRVGLRGLGATGYTLMWTPFQGGNHVPYFSDGARNDDTSKNNMKQINEDATGKYIASTYCTTNPGAC